LSREELAEYARRLSMLGGPGVEEIYRSAHNDCRMGRAQACRTGSGSAVRGGVEGVAQV